MTGPLPLVALALTLASALLMIVLIVRRLFVARGEQRRLDREAELRPLALALIDGEAIARPLDRRESQVLADILTRYSRQLSGDAQDLFADFFRNRGHVAREVSALGEHRAWKRATAAYVLGDMSSRVAIPDLIGALDDPERDVRAAAARSLGRLRAAQAVKPLVESLASGRVPRAVAGQALLSIGEVALPTLRELARDPELPVRTTAIQLIGLLGDPDDGVALIGSMRDPSAEVRAKAARALGRLGTPPAAAALRAALKDRVPFVRTSAAHALGMIGDHEASGELLEQARSDLFDPAHAAAAAVARIDPAAVRAAAAEPDPGQHVLEAADRLAARESVRSQGVGVGNGI